MFSTPAYAQSLFGSDASSFLASPIPMLVLMFAVFYFLLIRPQQQRQKQMKAMLQALRRGDRVVTAGGIIGTVAKVIGDTEVAVDIAENTRVRVVRSTITQVLSKPEPAAAKSKDKDKKTAEDEDEEEKETEVAKSD
jgi:preprotein translocase subunit YajC